MLHRALDINKHISFLILLLCTINKSVLTKSYKKEQTKNINNCERAQQIVEKETFF